MKKFLFLLVVAMLATVARAEVGDTFTVGDIKYTITSEKDHTVEVGPDNQTVNGVTIPSFVDYDSSRYSVTSIGGGAFVSCRYITSVTIPNTVTSIGGNAFWGCERLRSIDIPNSVTSIGDKAFWRCERLTSIDIPNSVTSIGSGAFGYSGLTSVEIPNSVSSIERVVFIGCKSLASVEIPNSIVEIEEGAFKGCSSLTSVEIPETVGYIANNTFEGCSSLTSVEIPETVGYIGSGAFEGCSSLTSVEIPEAVGYIGSGAFKDCYYLTSVEIPNSIVEIEDETFYGCSRLTSVEIPNSVTSIGNSAFYGCSSMSWLIIPENQTGSIKIGECAFQGCTSLFSVMCLPRESEIARSTFRDCSSLSKVAAYDLSLFESEGVFEYVQSQWTIEDDEPVDAEKGIIWSADKTQCWLSGKYTGSLIMPDGMTVLGWNCFAFCKNLTDVQLPGTLEQIGVQAFQGTGVKEVVIPNRVTKIYDDAFGDAKLVKAAYPDALESPFDESVVAIKYDAVDSKITDNFVYSRSGDKLHYAPLSVSAEFKIPASVTEITDKAFSKCEALTKIILPEKLSALGNSVWEDCVNITTVVCNNPEPVEAERDAFHVNVYKDATLYVPKGSKAKYESTKPWSYFYNISDEGAGDGDDDDKVGINDITQDAADAIDCTLPVEVYNLQGVMVADSVDSLPAGLYIVRQGKNVKKVAVK